ncbi:MAG TPA: SDR family oxidoreductase [Candidatus Limnocylindrales bacterium]|nr:SDR family oxidoreductase [Candidatus Limnocylindrales bacterium]
MTSRILVTGGTGTLGHLVVSLLNEADNKIIILSRHGHPPVGGVEYVIGDLLKGEGIEPAVDGSEIIVHLAGGPKGDEVAAANLMRVAARAEVRHVVLISVVGADRVPIGYFRSKLGAERVVMGSGVPWTTLRATQFHDLVLKVAAAMAKLPVIPIPSGIRFQPIEAGEVASRIAELALDEPRGLVEDVAGPRIYETRELMRSYLSAAGRHRLMMPMPLPGKGARALRAGANLAPGRAVGLRTWEEFLAAHF